MRIRLSPVPTVHKRCHLKSGVDLKFAVFSIHRFGNSRHSKLLVAQRLEISRLRDGAFSPHKRTTFFVSYVNADVIWHYTALHEDPRLVADHVEDSHKRLSGPLQDADDYAFLTFAVCLLLGYGHFHGITVQCALGLSVADKYVILHSFNLDKNESVPCHLDSSRIVRAFLQRLFIIFSAHFSGSVASTTGHASFSSVSS